MSIIESNIVFFIYTLSLAAISMGLAVVVLSNKGKRTPLTESSTFFYTALFIFTIVSGVVFGTRDNFTNAGIFLPVHIILVIAALMGFLWIRTNDAAFSEVECNKLSKFKGAVMVFALICAGLQLIWTVLPIKSTGTLLSYIPISLSIILSIGMLALNISYIVNSKSTGEENQEAGEKAGENRFILSVSTLLVTISISCDNLFYSKLTLVDTEEIPTKITPMGLITALLILLSNIALLILATKYMFKKSYVVIDGKNDDNISTPIIKSSADKTDIFEKLKKEYSLTDRETELCSMIFDGKSNAEIAEELFISESTVKTHIYNLYKKTAVKSRMEIIRLVREEF